MFALKKIALVAASVALALASSSVSAEDRHSNHVRIHVSKSAGATPAMAPVGVAAAFDDSSDDSSEVEEAVEADSSDVELSDVPVANRFANVKSDESPPPPGQLPSTAPTNKSTSKPTPKPTTDNPDSPPPVTQPPGFKRDPCAAKGQNKVYVMFNPGVYFCVSGTPCGGSKKGACPGPGRYVALPYGSYCFEYLAGDYRCAENLEMP